MIKIRYRDPRELAPGLYAAAERHSRGTTVYLLPGLSVAQRRAALRRLRISARRGCGPQLPAPQLAVALLVHRIRTAAGRAGAVFRSHPAASTVPVMVVSAGAIAFLALSAVSIRVIQPPRGASLPSFAGVAAAGLPANAGAPGGRPRYAGRADPGQAGQAGGQPTAGSWPGANGTPGNGPSGTAGNGTAGNGTGASGVTAPGSVRDPGSSRGSSGGTTPAGGADQTPAPGATASSSAPATASSTAPSTEPGTASSTGPAPPPVAPQASASPTPGASQSGTCLDVGPLGLCL